MSSVPRRSTRPSVNSTDDRRPVQRDVSRLPAVIASIGLLTAAYLLLAVGCGGVTSSDRPEDDCYDRVVYHAARLSDC